MGERRKPLRRRKTRRARQTEREGQKKLLLRRERERKFQLHPLSFFFLLIPVLCSRERERERESRFFRSFFVIVFDKHSQSVLRERMGACCGKASSSSGYSDYQTADREKMLQATEARVQKQEARGVTARGAAKLKDNATKKHHAEGLQQDTNMKWTVG